MPVPTRMPKFCLSLRLAPIALALVALGMSACSSATYKKWADNEVFGLLRKKASKVPNSGQSLLDITPPQPVKMEELRKSSGKADFLGDRAFVEENARVVAWRRL
jgi:hypothetical protein